MISVLPFSWNRGEEVIDDDVEKGVRKGKQLQDEEQQQQQGHMSDVSEGSRDGSFCGDSPLEMLATKEDSGIELYEIAIDESSSAAANEKLSEHDDVDSSAANAAGVDVDDFRDSFFQYCAPDSAKDALFDAWIKSTGWPDFFDPAKVSLVFSTSALMTRVRSNWSEFFHNYVLVALFFVAFGVALEPLACLSFVVVFVTYAVLFIYHDSHPCKLGPLTIHEHGKSVALLVVSLASLSLTGSFQTLLILAMISCVIIALHTLLMTSREERVQYEMARPPPADILSAADAETAHVECDSIV